MRPIAKILLTLALFVVSIFIDLSRSAAKGPEPVSLATTADKLKSVRLKEEIAEKRKALLSGLSGGYFHAPDIARQIDSIIQRFQKTRLFPQDPIFSVVLSGSPEINAGVRRETEIDEVKLYYVVVYKGLIDLVSDKEALKKVMLEKLLFQVQGVQFSNSLELDTRLAKLPNEQQAELLKKADEFASRITRHGRDLIAAVLAHEMGHIILGHADNIDKTIRVYFEQEADRFGTRLLAEAGFDPRVMIEMFEVLDSLRSVHSIEELLKKMFDEHPKPSARIASIQDLVETLGSSKRAEERFGESTNTQQTTAPEPLVRNPKLEELGKNTVEVLNQKLDNDQYKSLPFRGRLKFLEEYFRLNRQQAEISSRPLIIAILKEYTQILAKVDQGDDLQLVNDSVRRFQESLGLMAEDSNKKKPKLNVKKNIRELKHLLANKQVEFATEKLGDDVLKNLNTWMIEVDAPILMGMLNKQILKARSLEEVSAIYHAVMDRQHLLQAKTFAHNTQKSLEAVTVNVTQRVLELTGSLEKTLDFLEKEARFADQTVKVFNMFSFYDRSTIDMPYSDAISLTLLMYLLKNEKVDADGFERRLNDPKTAVDKAMSEIFYLAREKVVARLSKKRNLAAGVVTGAPTFSYGFGRKDVLLKLLSPTRLSIIYRLSGEEGLRQIVNEFIVDKYSLPQVFEILIREDPTQQAFWNELKSKTLESKSSTKGDELKAQLRKIAAILIDKKLVDTSELEMKIAHMGSSFQVRDLDPSSDGPLGTIARVSQKSQEIQYAILSHVSRELAKAPVFKFEGLGGGSKSEDIAMPSLSRESIDKIPVKNRVEYLDGLFRNDVYKVLRRFGERFIDGRQALLEAIDQLLVEAKISNLVREEFLNTYDQTSSLVASFLRNPGQELTQDFFILRRKLRMQLRVLNLGGLNIKTLTSARFFEALSNVSDLGDERLSKNGIFPRTNSFLVRSQEELLSYLDGKTAFAPFVLAADIAELIARYEGLKDFKSADQPPISRNLVLAKSIYHAVSPTFENNVKPAFLMSASLPLEEQMKLMPLDQGFQDLIVKTQKRMGYKEGGVDDFLDTAAKDLWPFILYRASTAESAIDALAFTMAYAKLCTQWDEYTTRLFFGLLTQSLRKVETKEQMEVFASLYAHFVRSAYFAKLTVDSFLEGDPKELAKVSQVKYREKFYDLFAKKLNGFDAWMGAKTHRFTVSAQKTAIRVVSYLYFKVSHYAYDAKSDRPPFVLRVLLANEIVKRFVIHSFWYKGMTGSLKKRLSKIYTRLLLARDLNPGRLKYKELLEAIHTTNFWSEEVDRAVAQFAMSGKYNRRKSMEIIKFIRSPVVRAETYEAILTRDGLLKVGLREKTQNYLELVTTYLRAKEIWTHEVIVELGNKNGFWDKIAVMQKAWSDHAAKRAAEKGVSYLQAAKLLIDLGDAKKKVETPQPAEARQVFREGSRHGDSFVERYAKALPTTYEQAKAFEDYKSYRTTSPFHQMAKAFFEFVDEYITKLSTTERAEVALYLSGVNPEVPVDIDKKVRALVNGTKNRKRALRTMGAQISLRDFKRFFSQAHPEEKMMAFSTLLRSGIIGDRQAEEVLLPPLLFSDPEMPRYLKRLLQIFLKVVNDNERNIFSSWILANSGKGPLSGPDIVQFIVSKGGVASAKGAQVVASHGFDLDPRYREVLEKFKGQAQNVNKIEAMSWIRERLAPDKFEQIESIDRELGSGSFKIGYLCTLKPVGWRRYFKWIPGANDFFKVKIAIMLPREHVREKTAREFEIIDKMVQEIMADPELRRDNIPPAFSEIERIIREEMKILNEEKYMKAHNQSYAARPFLVRYFGNSVRVLIPQPIEGWSNDKILVEQYIKSKSWTELKETSLFGWSKRKLARAAISEGLNQMMSYMSPREHFKGQVLLDIDLHEENELAKSTLGIDKMVNIDLGQTKPADPEVVRQVIQMLAFVYFSQIDEAVEASKSFMAYRSPKEVENFRQQLKEHRKNNTDPFEVITRTFQMVAQEGTSMKKDYLFFQKLFATLVGLKRHADSPSYLEAKARKLFALVGIKLKPHESKSSFITKQTKKIAVVRGLAQPIIMYQEVQAGLQKLKENRKNPSKGGGDGATTMSGVPGACAATIL